MTITLEIPEELKNELANEASQLGISLPEYTFTCAICAASHENIAYNR